VKGPGPGRERLKRLDDKVLLIGTVAVGVQLAIVALLAGFFIFLSRSVKLAEVRLWAMAWSADAVAIAAVVLAAFLQPSEIAIRALLVLYASGKTAYVFLLVAGARHHVHSGLDVMPRGRLLAVVVAVWGLALGLLAPRLSLVQLGQAVMVGGMLTMGGAWMLRRPRFQRSRWLGVALLVQGALFLHYLPVLMPIIWGGRPLFGYLTYSSFFDAAVELFVALASLVALESSAAAHLQHLNDELVASEDRLRQLVDLDPLTGLPNRRGLRDTLARANNIGAALIVLDIDDFKGVNDRFGHIRGDACLQRVANLLRHAFRSEDSVFRWGGDEFLVVAPGMTAETAGERVGALRRLLHAPDETAPPCDVSVGISLLAPGGRPEEAIHEADALMYGEKKRAGRAG